MKQKEFKSVKQYLISFAVAICCTMTSAVFTACSNEDTPAPKEQQTDLVLNFGDIVVKPYLGFGTSLADADKYFQAEYPDYANWEIYDVDSYEDFGKTVYVQARFNEDRMLSFYFYDADCKNLVISSYSFVAPIQLETVTAELERHGFKNMGEIRFPDPEADLTYLFLSADEKLEVLVEISYATEEFDEMWGISFQPLDERDLEYLVKE
jgi:hypothetical protein